MSEVLPKSVIVLKHTLIEGRVPTSDILEVGEVALGLFPGQESIWSKNSNGEIVNLRSPRHDLFWGDLFVKYKTITEFNTAKSEGKILSTAIVFIEESKEIWIDGILYSSPYTLEEIEKIVQSKFINIPSSVFTLNSKSTSSEISASFYGVNNFLSIVEKAIEGDSLSSMKIPGGGSTPVSVIPEKISEPNNYKLTFDYIYCGEYSKMIINYIDGVFSVNKASFDIASLGERMDDLEYRMENLESLSGGEFIWNEIKRNN